MTPTSTKQYLLSVAMIDGVPVRSPEEMQPFYEQVNVLNAELQASGAWVFGGGLQPADIATVVRAEGDMPWNLSAA